MKKSSGIREGILTRAQELESLTAWLSANSTDRGADTLAKAVKGHLDAARQVAHERRYLTQALVERAGSNLDAADALLLNIAPAEYILGALPSIVAFIEANLQPGNRERVAVERIAHRVASAGHPVDLVKEERDQIDAAMRAARSAVDWRRSRLRQLRTAAYLLTAGLMMIVATLAIVAWVDPSRASLCFQADGDVSCPTKEAHFPEGSFDDAAAAVASRPDYIAIEMIGALAGAAAATLMLRHLRGTSTPYDIPVALAALKLPAGALSAVLGLFAVQAGLLLGLPAIRTQGQLLAFAALFGFVGQQIMTRPMDQIGGILLAGGDTEDSRLPVSKIFRALIDQVRGTSSG